MTTLIAFAAVISFFWWILALIGAAFGRRSRRLKQSATAFVIMIVALIAMPDSTSRITAASNAPARAVSSEVKAPTNQASPQNDPQPTRAEAYREELEATTSFISTVKPSDFTQSIEQVAIALAMFDLWASLYAEGETLNLDQAGKTARSNLLRAAKAKQASMLPVLRDGYGPIMRKTLWIEDGGARTVGDGFRTVKFHHWSFAANRRVQEAYTASYEMLSKLRFTRVEYRWIDSDYGEYTYYTIDGPADAALGKWRGSSFSSVE